MIVEHIRNHTDLLRIREEWNQFLFSSDLNSIFLTHEWFSTWWRYLSNDSGMEVLIFRDFNGDILGIAPLKLIGDKILFAASQEVSDYCDFISHSQSRREFYRLLLERFRRDYPGITRFEFINIRESSPSLLLIPELALKYGFICDRKESDVAPGLELPLSYGEYMSCLNRKSRHELRRKLRRIEVFEELRSEKITEASALDISIEDFIGLHRNAGLDKANFWRTEGMKDFFQKILHQFALRGWVELRLLMLKDSLLASLIQFMYRDEVLLYNVAFSADYARFSPGFYLFHASIKDAITARKKRVDFLRGGEKYKYDFGAKECKIHTLTLTTEASSL